MRVRSLVFQLLAIVVFPTLFALVLVAYGGVWLHEHAMQSLIGERDERAVRAASEALADRFAQRQTTLRLLANQVANGTSITRLLDENPDLAHAFDGGLIAVDERAVVLDSWQPGQRWENSLRSAASPWILEHQAQPAMVIANVQSANRKVTLFGGISLTSLNVPDMMALMKNNALTDLYLVADDGHIIADMASVALGSVWKANKPVVDPHQPADGVVRYDNPDNLIVSSAIDRLNWTLVIQEPWDEVINAPLKNSLIAPLAVIPAVLLAMAIFAFGVVSIVLPLGRLRRAAGGLAWGDYTALHRPVGGIQEIRDLQATLNHMAQRLQQAQAGMHSYIGAMLQGQEDERTRLARELHDDTLQALIALDQQRQMAQRALERDPAKAAMRLQQLATMSQEMIHNLRQIIRNMRPAYLEDLGLTPALEMLSTQNAQGTATKIHFALSGTQYRLMPNRELGLYRIAQEGVANALHHAKATWIEVSLSYDTEVSLKIVDNGCGFVVPDRPGAFAQKGHYGLMGIVERAEQIGAQFRIKSAPGKGTQIEVSLSEQPI